MIASRRSGLGEEELLVDRLEASPHKTVWLRCISGCSGGPACIREFPYTSLRNPFFMMIRGERTNVLIPLCRWQRDSGYPSSVYRDAADIVAMAHGDQAITHGALRQICQESGLPPAAWLVPLPLMTRGAYGRSWYFLKRHTLRWVVRVYPARFRAKLRNSDRRWWTGFPSPLFAQPEASRRWAWRGVDPSGRGLSGEYCARTVQDLNWMVSWLAGHRCLAHCSEPGIRSFLRAVSERDRGWAALCVTTVDRAPCFWPEFTANLVAWRLGVSCGMCGVYGGRRPPRSRSQMTEWACESCASAERRDRRAWRRKHGWEARPPDEWLILRNIERRLSKKLSAA